MNKGPIVATLHSEQYQPLADITLPYLEKYCRRHGYALYNETYTHNMAHIGWARFCRVLMLLEAGHEMVLWADADVLITNPTMKLDEWTRLAPITMTPDLHGWNTGLFLAQNEPLVKQLFYAITGVYGQEHFLDHKWGEQAAFIHLTSSPPYSKLVDSVFHFNAYINKEHGWPDYVNNNWEIGDFAVQFAGMPLGRRIALAREMTQRYDFS